MLRFNDGVNIDTSGEYRTLHLRDGWYVVGHGLCSPEASQEAAEELVRRLRASDRPGQHPDVIYRGEYER